jgi:hypothetical protein
LRCARFAWNKAHSAAHIELMTCHGTQRFAPFPVNF